MHKDRQLTYDLSQKYGNEQVFVIPTYKMNHIEDKFTMLNKFQSGRIANIALLNSLNKYDKIGLYLERYKAEYDNAFIQPIPFSIITTATQHKYYVCERIAGDDRLHKQYSLGWGGHIEPQDGIKKIILSALNRELLEEVDIVYAKDNNKYFLGTIRNLSSSTSEHIGFVFLVKATSVKVKETDKAKGHWLTLEQLEKQYYRFEDWSKILIDYLYKHKKFL